MRRRGDAVGEEFGGELLDVFGLLELDDVVAPGELNAEEVGEFALVLYLPLALESRDEGVEEGVLIVVQVHDRQIVHVNAYVDAFTAVAVGRAHGAF